MFLLFLCIIYLPVVASTDKQYTALHFGTSNSDYISFNYDMAPFRDSLSICTWIKRISTSSSYPVVFNYLASGHEILIGPDGYHNRVVGDTGLENRRNLVTVPVGTWFSYCITWSVASTTIKLYLDGDLVATDQTASGRRLTMGGQLWFGGLYSRNSGHVFGGDLYQFNVYSNVLESAEIKKIADGGLCFDLEEFSDTRILRWEDILDRSRSGSVSEVEVCTRNELITRLRESQEKLANVTGRLNGTEAQLSRLEEKVETLDNLLNSTQEELESSQLSFTEAKKQLNVTNEKLVTTEEELKGVTSDLEEVTADLEEVTAELEEVTADMNRTETSLETVTGDLNSTQAELGAVSDDLETCSAGLKDIGRKFKDSRTFHNVTRWDVLLTPPYFNKVFSNELFRKLTTSWNMLERFVGMNMTEGVIQHFRYFHREPQCDVFEHLSHAMLEHFKGTEITSGLIAHFKETHTEESECENDTDTES
ncbi:uncharacterized protein LOC134818533 isoform X2 [Bolinopsis microptera]|uniref:uncharacterized protein LOC134818533 isoform X1 n=1 Tax=Bolinopsis microptera TaxID=2820187 RepID=UPI00307B09AF